MKNYRVTMCRMLFAVLFSLCLTTANADHIPEQLLANGKPETQLAGVDLTLTKLNDVIRMYGKPQREIKVPNNPNWTGYVWELPQAKIELGVNGGPSGAQIGDIYVEGTSNKQVGSTGRGLKLGDNINAIRRIYGKNFLNCTLKTIPSGTRQEFTGVSGTIQRVTLQWKSQEFTLTAGLDGAGKIVALWLILPECYPGPCE